MEHQGTLYDMEDGECPDEFQCCVCLDIMYKPVVLACGHISCFWCVFKAMDSTQESYCPVCRNQYYHFPRICNLLHVLLLKLYPSAYKRRERQVAEEEKVFGHASPQCKGSLIDSQFREELDSGDLSSHVGAVHVESKTTCGGDGSFFQEISKRTLCGEVNTISIPTTSSSHTVTDKANCTVKRSNQVPLTDLKCVVCKELLCRPVVINCGHVYCEVCIGSQDAVYKCPVCQSAHPNGFPSVCLVLDHFLEEHYPEEYSARKESLRNFQNVGTSGGSTGKQELTQCSPVNKNVYPSQFSQHGTKFHPGIGCDYCGMFPIIGLRYKCKDCVETIGFDLCIGCYNSSSKLPGRFNQQHTQDHQFLEVQPTYPGNVILSFGSEQLQEFNIIFTNASTPEEDLENEVEVVNSLDDYEQVLEDAISSPNSNEVEVVNSLDDYEQALEDAMSSPNSSNNRLDNQDSD